jgi:hypothetical protein
MDQSFRVKECAKTGMSTNASPAKTITPKSVSTNFSEPRKTMKRTTVAFNGLGKSEINCFMRASIVDQQSDRKDKYKYFSYNIKTQ